MICRSREPWQSDAKGLFEHLWTYSDKEMMELQGTYPVINISFATVKQKSYDSFVNVIKGIIAHLYREHEYLLTADVLDDRQQKDFCAIMNREADENAVILEFKVYEEADHSLEATARGARRQIEEKQYEVDLRGKGFKTVRKYGFGFKGKEVLIVE